MLRRLLARRAAPKVEKTEDETKTIPVKNNEKNNSINNDDVNNDVNNEVNNEVNNMNNKNESIKLEEEYLKIKDDMKSQDVDNKLVSEELEQEEEVSSIENQVPDESEEDEIEDHNSDITEDNSEFSEESEEEEEKIDDEKESVDEPAYSSTESLVESEIEMSRDKMESPSDGESKDSGIEKGDSPTLISKDTTDEEAETTQDNETETPTKTTVQNSTIPELRTSSFVGTATVNVLSPASAKPKRFVKRSNSARRPRNDIDLESELSCDSSPEKRRPRRKNMTVSYLSYPQRFVRSSLAVEARLSQWHKETSVVEGRGSPRVDTPTRNGILKQTAQNTLRNSISQRNSMLKAPRRDVTVPSNRVTVLSNRLSESDASSDEDHTHMSVRKIYSSKSALRKRMENLEGILLSMATQKKGLEGIIVVMEMWSLDLSHVERTKLGVPYIRSVKEVLKKHRQILNSKKSEFSTVVSLLQEAKVPRFDEVNKQIKQLQKDISSIVQDRKRYSSRHIEDIRQIQGQIIGTCSAITAVFYEE